MATRLTADQLYPGSNPGLGFLGVWLSLFMCFLFYVLLYLTTRNHRFETENIGSGYLEWGTTQRFY